MPRYVICPACGNASPRYPSSPYKTDYCSRLCKQPIPQPLYSDDGLTARIALMGRDRSVRAYVTVDAADAEWVSQWRWSLHSEDYADRKVRRDGKNTSLLMHRALLAIEPDVDHRDRDRLNNCRSNLRAITSQTNPQNVSAHRGATSGYRGVTWDRSRGKWMAHIRVDGKARNLGRFDDEVEAAHVAQAARARLMPYAVD